MKKMIFTLTLLLGIVTFSKAQEANKMWVGGSVGVWHESVKDGDNLTSVKILPEFGYNLTDNWGLGIRLGYLHDEDNDNALNVREKKDGFNVNPFVRYSFLKGNLGNLFVDGGVGYAYTKNKTTDIKTHELEVGFRPGVAVNVTNKIALTGKFGFLGYEYEKDGDRKTNSFGFDFDMRQFELGVNIVF